MLLCDSLLHKAVFCKKNQMSERIFRCCKRKPSFSVTYSVAGEQKHYHVCSKCIHLDCFSKYIIEKTPIRTQFKKKFQNEISDETVENEITNGKFDELIEQNENLTENNEKGNDSQHVSKNRGNEKP